MRVVGIDPGLSGAVALVWPATPETVTTWDTPTVLVKVGTHQRRDYDAAAMVNVLVVANPGLVILERPHAMPKSMGGSLASFSLGRGVGVWEGILAALRFRYELVSPQRWKQYFQLLGQPKDASRLKAARLFPSAELHLKKHDGRAEALLLAEYGRHIHGVHEDARACGV